MKHFLFEDKEYEINPEYKTRAKDKTRTALQLGALYLFCKSKKNKALSYSQYRSQQKLTSFSSGVHTGSVKIDKRQNCIAKVHYSKSMIAHNEQINRYLQREGAGKDGERPVLFGDDKEIYKDRMVAKNFRIFLSPGKTDISQQVLTRTFMKKLELQTGYKFTWLAASHYNTAHPHTHILINGLDKEGRDVFFRRDLIKTIMRDTAMDICTSLAGERTREQIQKEKDAQLVANRYTFYDKKLKDYINDYKLFPPSLKSLSEIYMKRISHLEKLGLCKYENSVYKFQSDWDSTLRIIGRYNMFLNAKQKLQYTDKSRFSLYDYQTGEVAGIITQIYKTDDISDNHAAVLEGANGKAYFIPLFYKPTFKKGDIISVKPKENQKGRLTPYVTELTEKEFSKIVDKFDYKMTRGYGAHFKNQEEIER